MSRSGKLKVIDEQVGAFIPSLLTAFSRAQAQPAGDARTRGRDHGESPPRAASPPQSLPISPRPKHHHQRCQTSAPRPPARCRRHGPGRTAQNPRAGAVSPVDGQPDAALASAACEGGAQRSVRNV